MKAIYFDRKFKKQISILFNGDFTKMYKHSIILCSITSMIPAFVNLVFEKFLPDPSVYRNITDTYDDLKSLIPFTSFFALIAIHILVATCNTPAKYQHDSKPSIRGYENLSDKIKEISAENTFVPPKLSYKKEIPFILSIIPLIPTIISMFVYVQTLGIKFRLYYVIILIIGLGFIISGAYINKAKRNFLIPFKKNDINLKKTYRFMGDWWVISGAFLICSMYLEGYVFLVLTTIFAFVVPYTYFFIINKKTKSSE